MIRKNIFIDFDGVISNTIETIVSLYNEDYCNYHDYKEVHWSDINSWEFTELNCAKPEEIDKYFSQYRFFNNIILMPNVEYAIFKMLEKYDITVVSMGSAENLIRKYDWIKGNMPQVNFIGCQFSQNEDKSHIDMSGGIFIDDLAKNLETSNAETKICFGDIYPWNDNWKGIRCYNWHETLRYLGLED